jgi:hypothetical protein
MVAPSCLKDTPAANSGNHSTAVMAVMVDFFSFRWLVQDVG